MKRPRPFAVERRRLSPAKAVERIPGRSAVSGWLQAPTASTPRETRGNQHSDGDGSVAADVGRILRGRTDFPKLLWGEVI